MDWKLNFIESKYHLAVARRMMKRYAEYPEKRFLIGVINESVKSVSNLILAFLIYEQMNVMDKNLWTIGHTKNLGLKDFLKIAPKYLKTVTCENLIKIFEIKAAQKVSPIELAKGEKIIFLVEGKYRVLTTVRIDEFMNSVNDAIIAFPGNARQV